MSERKRERPVMERQSDAVKERRVALQTELDFKPVQKYLCSPEAGNYQSPEAGNYQSVRSFSDFLW